MLYQALYVPATASPLPREVVFQPELAKYVQNWGANQDDTGLVAVLNAGTLIGAVWLRRFTNQNPGYGYIDDDTPELSIAVLPAYRDRGVGTKLLTTLFSQSKNCYPAISLSVSANNPAKSLYQRLGFEVISRDRDSLIMKKDL